MDTEGLLRSLNAHGVDYVVIGATAFPVHGYSRATLDIDIFIRPTRDNAEKTRAALTSFGYDLSEATVPDLLSHKILIRQYALETDIHPFVKGADFDGVWKRKVPGQIGGADAFFASLDDLIAMKKAAGRPRDREDVKILLKIRQRSRREAS